VRPSKILLSITAERTELEEPNPVWLPVRPASVLTTRALLAALCYNGVTRPRHGTTEQTSECDVASVQHIIDHMLNF